MIPVIYNPVSAGKSGNIAIETPELFLKFHKLLRIRNGSKNFQTVSDDSCILHPGYYLNPAELCHNITDICTNVLKKERTSSIA